MISAPWPLAFFSLFACHCVLLILWNPRHRMRGSGWYCKWHFHSQKKNARSIHHGELAPISGICQGNILRWWLRFLWSVTSRTILAGTGTKITLRSDSVWIRDWLETVLNYDAINTGFPFSKDSQKNLANDGNRSRGNWFDGLMLEEKN